MKRSTCICILLTFSCLALVTQTISAETVNFGVTFQATNQNMWGSGNAASFNQSYFLGGSWDASGAIGPGVGCAWILGCWGGWLGGHTWGKAGLELSVHADAGSVNASYAADIGLTLPNQLHAGSTVQIASALDLQPGQLTTSFPNAEVVGKLVLEAHANISGQVCVYDCWGGTSPDLIGLNVHPELFSFNKNDNGQLDLMGISLPFNFGETKDFYAGPPYFGHLGDLTLNVPNLDLTGSADTLGGASGVGATGSVDVLTVHADVLNAGLQLAGIPPLSASVDFGIGSVSATLLEVNVGAALGIWQDFFLYDPSAVNVNLHVLETGEDLAFKAGDPFSFTVPTEYDQLHITPTFNLSGANFINNTDLLLSPSVDIDALEACIDVVGLGGCLGPLYDYPWQGSGLHINAYDKNFNIDFGSVQGDTFVVQVARDSTIPEPCTLLLLASGITAGAIRRRLKSKGIV